MKQAVFAKLLIIMMLFAVGCSSGSDAEDIAGALSDRLTDALDFDGGSVKDGEPPAGKAGDDTPQISALAMSENLWLGGGVAVELQSDFAKQEEVDKAIVYVKDASKYIEVAAPLMNKFMSIIGKLKEDAQLKGKSFEIRFALQTKSGITGEYKTQPLAIQNNEAPTAKDVLPDVGIEGAELKNEPAPKGSSADTAPQITEIKAPSEIFNPESFEITLYTDFADEIMAALLTLPNSTTHMEIPAQKSDNMVKISGSFLGKALKVGDSLSFLFALKGKNSEVGLYRVWDVKIIEKPSNLDGDEDKTVPEDGDKAEVEEVADDDETDNSDTTGQCSGICNVMTQKSFCVGMDVCWCQGGTWKLYTCSSICGGKGQTSTGCGDVTGMDYPYCQCSGNTTEDGDLDSEVVDTETDSTTETDVETELEQETEVEQETETGFPTGFCDTNICWPVPPTGQDKCYTWESPYEETTCPGGIPASCGNPAIEGCGQDAQYPDNDRTFTCYNATGTETPCANLPTASVDEVVTDSLTGLMWQRTYVSFKTWQESIDYCEGLTYGGYSDWRLPGTHELFSMVDFINTDAFQGTSAYPFRSSTVDAKDSLYMWVVTGGSTIFHSLKTNIGDARCVRLGVTESGGSSFSRFFESEPVSNEIIVEDTVTELIWQKNYVDNKDWGEGLAYCEELDYGGYADWRLPNKNELVSLINFEKHTPASDFPDMPVDFFSSSTPSDSGVETHWIIDLTDQAPLTFNYGKEYSGNIRCVRSKNGFPTGYCDTNICWPVPPTGQDKCYTWESPYEETTCPGGIPASCGNPAIEGCGQDAQYPDNDRTFTCYNATGTETPCANLPTASVDEVVTDSLTGLMWQRTFVSGKSWQEAVDYCENLTYGGRSDWILPNPHEFLSLVDNGKSNPAIDVVAFPGTPSSVVFWSSSSYADYTNLAWYVNFGYGDVLYGDKTSTGDVRCAVRLWPEDSGIGSFEHLVLSGEAGSEVVTDTVTGLIWQKNYATGKTWQEALAYCEELDYGGYANWRLPNKNELSSLVNYKNDSPVTDFPDMPSSSFWSSSSGANSTSHAWYVYFSSGYVNYYNKTSTYSVRCVRSESSVPIDGDVDEEEDLEPELEAEIEAEAEVEEETPDPVWVDPATGFEWQQEATGGDMTWALANTHCSTLALDGGGWRLPNLSELRSIARDCSSIETSGACGVKDECSACGVSSGDTCLYSSGSCWETSACIPTSCADDGGSNGCYWPQELSGTCDWMWSLSEVADMTGYSWGVHFLGGHINSTKQITTNGVRCIRGDGFSPDGDVDVEDDIEAEVEEESSSLPADYCRHAFCWNIPTNQSGCYDGSASITCPTTSSEDFYGQAGNYYNSGNVRDFECYDASGLVSSCPSTPSEGDMVKDDTTGLMWQRRMDPVPAGCEAGSTAYCTYDEAVSYCDNLDYGGFTDWHLPGIAELLSLFDMAGGVPAIDSFYFMDTPAEVHVSSTVYVAANHYHYVDFQNLFANYQAKTEEGAVRCVRVSEEVTLPSERYTEHGTTETVYEDNITGLEWKSTTEGYLNWQTALSTCESLSWNGHNDWRVPTMMEALTYVSAGKETATWTDLPGMAGGHFSSVTRSNGATWAFQVNTSTTGIVNYNRKTNVVSIRCVRKSLP